MTVGTSDDQINVATVSVASLVNVTPLVKWSKDALLPFYGI